MGLLKFRKIKKTKVEEQIDTIQMSVSQELERVNKLITASLDVLEYKAITEQEKASIKYNLNKAKMITKNLASDLERDARL